MKSHYQITEKLWQGAAIEMTPAEYENFELVLDLCGGVPHDVDTSVLHWTIPDDPEGLTESAFWILHGICLGLSFVDAEVLTVCMMGENRSGLASAMFLWEKLGSIDQAIKLLRGKVPPRTDNPHVLWNPGFERQLRQWLS